ncbi:Ger(x)C family spore germination protein [Effusibacillus dendaii]|uniref:Spore germination protein YndF n=1 Tax=Effusibacillus dendaii TaxID=2743772 RepID=A0A7I8D9K2_9BACL|nr:Ger(x)C family spore germination protein [Effusibacillus dendaii]BCJ86833.1 spore germination protein YndF [Effusibacillus dendaii]
MLNQKAWIVTVCLLALVSLTGCWDRIEIEERGFVMALAIDLAPEKAKQGQKQKIQATYQIAIPAKLRTSGQSASVGGGGEEKAFLNITTSGDVLFKTARIASTRSSRSPYFEHTQVVLIGEELAREGYLDDIADVILRDNELRRKVTVITVQGKARDVLNSFSPQEKLMSEYIESLSENSRYVARMPKDLSVGLLSQRLNGRTSFAMQRIFMVNNQIHLSGSAVYNGSNEKLVGWLNGEETEGLLLLTGQYRGGVLVSDLPSGERVAVEVKQAATKLTVTMQNGMPSFRYQIEVTGEIGESWSTRNTLDETMVHQVERSTEKEVKRLTGETIKTLQTELKTDAIGLGATLARKHPDVWRKIKENWDNGQNMFSQVDVQVNAKATVTTPGSILMIEKKK